VLVKLHQPRTRADIRVRVQIRDVHKLNLTTDGHRWTQIKPAAQFSTGIFNLLQLIRPFTAKPKRNKTKYAK
jgi:hypothetical protein